MKYKVEYTPTAVRQLKKMDKHIAAFILSFIEEKLVGCTDPRLQGKPLQGNLSDKWRYRVGSCRILCQIEDTAVIITVVEVGRRKDIHQ